MAKDDDPNEAPADGPRRGRAMQRFRNYFLTGLVIAAPLFLTVYLTWAFVVWIDSWVTPVIPPQYNPNTYLPFLQDCWRQRIPETWRDRGFEYPKDVPLTELIFVPDNAELYAAFGAAVRAHHPTVPESSVRAAWASSRSRARSSRPRRPWPRCAHSGATRRSRRW